MKTGQLEIKGKPLKEFVLVLRPEEIEILHAALLEFVEKHPQRKVPRVLLNELSGSSVFM